MEVDEHGQYYIDTLPGVTHTLRLLSLTSASDICGLWAVRSDDSGRMYVIPKA